MKDNMENENKIGREKRRNRRNNLDNMENLNKKSEKKVSNSKTKGRANKTTNKSTNRITNETITKTKNKNKTINVSSKSSSRNLERKNGIKRETKRETKRGNSNSHNSRVNKVDKEKLKNSIKLDIEKNLNMTDTDNSNIFKANYKKDSAKDEFGQEENMTWGVDESKDMNKKNIKKEEKNKKGKSPYNRKGKKKMKTWKKVLIVLLVLLLILASIVGYFFYKVHMNGGGLSGIVATAVGNDQFKKKPMGEFRCLLLGISTDQEGVDLTDTIIVASYNPNTQKATLLSIPRDTYTGKNPSRATAYEKINALYSRKHRPDETLKAVEEITGLDIGYYCVVKTEALIKLVDVIGGVTFDVPIRMKYTDTSQDLFIDLQPGVQKLNGDQAEQLLRFRKNNNGTTYPEEYGGNDTGRMRTQREFIQAAIKQTAKPANIFKLNELIDLAKEYVITNIDFEVIKDYLPYAVEFDTSNLLSAVLPGVNTNHNAVGTWVFVPNKKEVKALVQELFVDRDVTAEDPETIEGESVDSKEITNNSGNAVRKADIKIEVLNGSGDSKNLQEVVSDLKGAGYKVYRTGSTTTTTKTTIVNKGDIPQINLTNIRSVICKGSIDEAESSSTSNKVDVQIILGKDY